MKRRGGNVQKEINFEILMKMKILILPFRRWAQLIFLIVASWEIIQIWFCLYFIFIAAPALTHCCALHPIHSNVECWKRKNSTRMRIKIKLFNFLHSLYGTKRKKNDQSEIPQITSINTRWDANEHILQIEMSMSAVSMSFLFLKLAFKFKFIKREGRGCRKWNYFPICIVMNNGEWTLSLQCIKIQRLLCVDDKIIGVKYAHRKHPYSRLDEIYCTLIKSYFHSTMKRKVHCRVSYHNDDSIQYFSSIGMLLKLNFPARCTLVLAHISLVQLSQPIHSIMSCYTRWQPSGNRMLRDDVSGKWIHFGKIRQLLTTTFSSFFFFAETESVKSFLVGEKKCGGEVGD